MGQWVVSVPGLEPLHLTVTLTSRMRWQQRYRTSRPAQPRSAGSTAGRWQVHDRSIRGPGDAMSFPWLRTHLCQELLISCGERVPAVSRSNHPPSTRSPRAREAASSRLPHRQSDAPPQAHARPDGWQTSESADERTVSADGSIAQATRIRPLGDRPTAMIRLYRARTVPSCLAGGGDFGRRVYEPRRSLNHRGHREKAAER